MPAPTSSSPAQVSVLGLGLMGSALAAAFRKAGHPTTVWNRSDAKTGPLVAQGALPADTAPPPRPAKSPPGRRSRARSTSTAGSWPYRR